MPARQSGEQGEHRSACSSGLRVAERLGRERYVSMTTFWKDGGAVPTPVWVVLDGGRLPVCTGTGTAARRGQVAVEISLD